MTRTVDPNLVTRLTGAVQDALVAEATERVSVGRPPLDRGSQSALADKVLRNELQRVDHERLSTGIARLDAATEQVLSERVLALSVGLGPVELLLADPSVEEVVATRFDLVFVYRSDGTVEEIIDRLWSSEGELVAWLAHLARTAGRTERQFNAQAPMLVMRLGEGLRLAACREVSAHVSFALRRNTKGKVTLADLVGLGMLPQVLAEFLAACLRAPEIRLVVSGATGAGKTTLLRACLGELERLARVVIIEDTAELDVFDPVAHPNIESWEARLANSEGEGGIDVGEQVKHALRYRPDWLVFGEVRDSDAAVPMVKAMTHGQAAMTTVHAPSAEGALDKLALYLGTGEDRLPPDVAHNQLRQALDVVVHVDRLADGRRVVAEVVEVAGFDGHRCTLNRIAERDRVGGGWTTMNRLTAAHADALARVGFDPHSLGGGFR